MQIMFGMLHLSPNRIKINFDKTSQDDSPLTLVESETRILVLKESGVLQFCKRVADVSRHILHMVSCISQGTHSNCIFKFPVFSLFFLCDL